MDNQYKRKFPLLILSISFIIAAFSFVSGFILGQKSLNLSNSSRAQEMPLKILPPPPSELKLPIAPPSILNAVTGSITNIIPGLDGNIVIEVSGISIRDIMTPEIVGKENMSKSQKYAFLVLPKTQITSISPPIPNIPIGDFMKKDLLSTTPSLNLTLKDLKTGMTVTVYTSTNQKIADKIEVVSLSTSSFGPTPTITSCSPLPESCKTDYPNCIATMGIPPGGWCSLNSSTPTPACSPLPDTCNKTTYPDCIALMGVPPGGWCSLD